jgi:hypothetical protein
MYLTKFLQRIGMALIVVMLTACTVSVVTPAPPIPVQPQQPIQQLPQPQQPQQGQQLVMPAPPANNSNGSSPSGTVLVDQTVTIPGGGGSAEVTFTATGSQRIQITLTASNAGMQPYGNLQYPDGTSQYNPPIDTAANGANKTEISLDQSGQFSLTVFDGSNQGGSVSVKVAILR